jgi:hypothetical protein
MGGEDVLHPSRLEIIEIAAGSLIVTIRINSAAREGTKDLKLRVKSMAPEEVRAELQRQLRDETKRGMLWKGKLTSGVLVDRSLAMMNSDGDTGTTTREVLPLAKLTDERTREDGGTTPREDGGTNPREVLQESPAARKARAVEMEAKAKEFERGKAHLHAAILIQAQHRQRVAHTEVKVRRQRTEKAHARAQARREAKIETEEAKKKKAKQDLREERKRMKTKGKAKKEALKERQWQGGKEAIKEANAKEKGKQKGDHKEPEIFLELKERETGFAKHHAVTAIQAVARMRRSRREAQQQRDPRQQAAATQMQKLVRERSGRKMMLRHAASLGKSLLAVRGTIQGKSGWYEKLESVKVAELAIDPAALVGAPAGASAEFEVSRYYELRIDAKDGSVAVLQGPLTPEDYKEVVMQRTLYMTVAHAVVRLQGNIRRAQARRAVMRHLQENEDTLLAMCGTVQGRSGWYEMLVEEKNADEEEKSEEEGEGKVAKVAKQPPTTMVVRYEVLGDGEWELKEGPMRKHLYYEAVAMVKERKEKAAKKAAMKAAETAKAEAAERIGVQRADTGKRPLSEVEVSMTVARAVVKMQAGIRRTQARKWLMRHLQEQRDTVLAMNGTVQGRSGWYEFIVDDGGIGATMVVRYDISANNDWLLKEGPFKKQLYLEAVSMKQKLVEREEQRKLRGKSERDKQKMIDLQTPEVNRRQMLFAEKRRASKQRMFEEEEDRKAKRRLDKKEAKKEAEKAEKEARRQKRSPEKQARHEARTEARRQERRADKPTDKVDVKTEVPRDPKDIAAIQIQSYTRRWQGRRMMLERAADFGSPLAMSGTIQGKSGWYERLEEGVPNAYELSVDEGGNWGVVRGPMGRRECRAVREELAGGK